MTTQNKTQRKSAKLKAEIALKALGGASRPDLAEKYGVSLEELGAWVDAFTVGGRDAFRSQADGAARDAEIARLQRKVGELYMRLEASGQASKSTSEEDEEL